MHVEVWARSEKGRSRAENEDAQLVADLASAQVGLGPSVRSHPVRRAGSVFAVCDGLGGPPAGEVASRLAVAAFFEVLLGSRESRLSMGERLGHALEAAGRRIRAAGLADPARFGMATTATVAAIADTEPTLWIAHVGDSRAYLAREGVVAQLTRDHTFVQQLVDEGVMTEAEARARHAKTLLWALGAADRPHVDLLEAPLRSGDRLLLCTDGLSDALSAEEIRAILGTEPDPRRACHRLVDAALAAGAEDDVTAIVVRFDGDALVAALPGEAPVA
jgi:protein phosphatase